MEGINNFKKSKRKKDKLQCRKCKKVFKRQFNLKRHMNRKYNCDYENRCEKCGQNFFDR